MSERRKSASDRTAAERLASIDDRQQHLLQELDRLNDRIEEALSDFSSARPGTSAQA